MEENQALRDGWGEKLGNISVVLLSLPGVLFLCSWLIGGVLTLLHLDNLIDWTASLPLEIPFLFTAIAGPILVIMAALIALVLTFRSSKSSWFIWSVLLLAIVGQLILHHRIQSQLFGQR
jgi:uncharacterized integral membrane protein